MHLYSNIDLKNEQSPGEMFKLFDNFFFKYGRFPSVNTLAIVPTGVVPSFVKSNDILLSNYLYENFNSTDAHGLVWVQFPAALNVFLGGNKIISEKCNEWIFS